MKILRTTLMVLALGCVLGASSSHPVAGSQRSGRRIVVTGRLTGEGVECQSFRSRRGVLYTLTGNLRGFKRGDRVRIVGRVAEMSTCMQGTTLSVESIRRAR